MPHKYHFNADLREVWLRLAGKYKADVAQVGERIFRTDEVGASTASIGSTLKERE